MDRMVSDLDLPVEDCGGVAPLVETLPAEVAEAEDIIRNRLQSKL